MDAATAASLSEVVMAKRWSNNSFGMNGSLVGAARFELATPCAQGRCATRLRYAPILAGPLILIHRIF
jgi:hypothetical protein